MDPHTNMINQEGLGKRLKYPKFISINSSVLQFIWTSSLEQNRTKLQFHLNVLPWCLHECCLTQTYQICQIYNILVMISNLYQATLFTKALYTPTGHTVMFTPKTLCSSESTDVTLAIDHYQCYEHGASQL